MRINADLSKRVVVHSNRIDWVPSPAPGVERRMLERVGDEIARATSIVRYAPRSSFKAHPHVGGEEFLVLDGVFSDETGDFSRGMYVRNPPGSQHAPSSAQGCTIFVKLHQMPPDDQNYVRVNTLDEKGWQQSRARERQLTLYESPTERVRMVGWEARAALDTTSFERGAELLVVDGGFEDEEGSYESGSWLRLPPGSRHTPRTSTGCRIYVKEASRT